MHIKCNYVITCHAVRMSVNPVPVHRQQNIKKFRIKHNFHVDYVSMSFAFHVNRVIHVHHFALLHFNKRIKENCTQTHRRFLVSISLFPILISHKYWNIDRDILLHLMFCTTYILPRYFSFIQKRYDDGVTNEN